MQAALGLGVMIALAITVFLADNAEGTHELCQTVALEAHQAKRKLFDYSALTPSAVNKWIGAEVAKAQASSKTRPQTPIGTDTPDFERDEDWKLRCDPDLSAAAEAYARAIAEKDKFFESPHSPETKAGKYGENISFQGHANNQFTKKANTVEYNQGANGKLVQGTEPSAAIRKAVDAWFDEVHCFKFDEPAKSIFGDVGHFTAMTGVDTAHIGIGVATSATGRVYVVANYWTLSFTGTNMNGVNGFPGSIPPKPDASKFAVDPTKCVRGVQKINGLKPTEVGVAAVLDTASAEIAHLVDAKMVKKERNKIARLAMTVCEESADLKEEFTAKMTGPTIKAMLNAAKVKDEAGKLKLTIGAILCGKDEIYQPLVTEYLHCVRRKSEEKNIGASTLVTDEYSYDRKIAQHRCERGYKSLTNVMLWRDWMVGFPLLSNAQKAPYQKAAANKNH